MSLDLYDFGTPVNVQAPPADQVTQLGSGLGGLGGGDSAAGALVSVVAGA